MLVQHLEPYKDQVDTITKHIKSDYMKEMATKSKTVCLYLCCMNTFEIFYQGSTGYSA